MIEYNFAKNKTWKKLQKDSLLPYLTQYEMQDIPNLIMNTQTFGYIQYLDKMAYACL